MGLQYLHSMVRVTNLEKSLAFYCDGLGLVEVFRKESESGRFTLIFLAAADDLEAAQNDSAPMIELTYNWDPEQYDGGRNFGHLAYRVDNIYAVCEQLVKAGVEINRPPRDGHMAFVRSPDNISIELLQQGKPCRSWSPGLLCQILVLGSSSTEPF
jgi:lactoylglutathione lyase